MALMTVSRSQTKLHTTYERTHRDHKNVLTSYRATDRVIKDSAHPTLLEPSITLSSNSSVMG